MSEVLIKGMKMPKNCSVCALNRALYCCAKSCGIRSYHENRTKPDWCPLIELPKHGRLIDADKLRAELPHPNDWRNPELAYAHLSGIWATIDCAETIIEAEGT